MLHLTGIITSVLCCNLPDPLTICNFVANLKSIMVIFDCKLDNKNSFWVRKSEILPKALFKRNSSFVACCHLSKPNLFFFQIKCVMCHAVSFHPFLMLIGKKGFLEKLFAAFRQFLVCAKNFLPSVRRHQALTCGNLLLVVSVVGITNGLMMAVKPM